MIIWWFGPAGHLFSIHALITPPSYQLPNWFKPPPHSYNAIGFRSIRATLGGWVPLSNTL